MLSCRHCWFYVRRFWVNASLIFVLPPQYSGSVGNFFCAAQSSDKLHLKNTHTQKKHHFQITTGSGKFPLKLLNREVAKKVSHFFLIWINQFYNTVISSRSILLSGTLSQQLAFQEAVGVLLMEITHDVTFLFTAKSLQVICRCLEEESEAGPNLYM